MQLLSDGLPGRPRVVHVPNPIVPVPRPDGTESPRSGVLFVGRLVADKGLVELIRAAPSRMLEQLVVLGGPTDGPYFDAVADECRRRDVDVEFCGWVSGDQVRARMRSSRALILPTIAFDNAPLVLGEALANGLRLAVSTTCGLATELPHGTVTFDPTSARSIAAACEQLLDDEVEATGLGDDDHGAFVDIARHLDLLIGLTRPDAAGANEADHNRR
jgi:glycosyltransferase involved in cell wall biosynthesis